MYVRECEVLSEDLCFCLTCLLLLSHKKWTGGMLSNKKCFSLLCCVESEGRMAREVARLGKCTHSILPEADAGSR